MDGEDQSIEIGCHVIARFMERNRGRSVEDKSTTMEINNEREFGVRGSVKRAIEANIGFGGGIERNVFRESELG